MPPDAPHTPYRSFTVSTHGPAWYRALAGRAYVWHWQIGAELLQELTPAGGRFLDVGCGDGQLLAAADGHFQDLVGLDVSPDAVAATRALLGDRADVVTGSLDDPLPFEDGAFDAVACCTVLEHVFDPHKAASELARVTRAGGTVLIAVPNLAYARHRLRLLRGRMPITALAPSPTTGWDGSHIQYFTWRELRALLVWAGLEPVRLTGSGAFARLRNWRPTLLCGDLLVAATKR